MNDKIDDGGPAFPRPEFKCSRCDLKAILRQGHQWLCAKHYRFGQMRVNAKRHHKTVPTFAELESLLHSQNLCADCGRKMNWLARDGQILTITLQHYRNGSFGLVCRSCNTRHAFMPGDSYRDSRKDHKFCPRCKLLRPFSEYSIDNGRTGIIRLKSWCKICSREAYREWRQHKTA